MAIKQVIVVRKDIRMGTGKSCAQVAHASLAAAEIAMEDYRHDYMEWKQTGEKKIVLSGESQEQLGRLFEDARTLNLPCYLVRDAGLTQLKPGTITALAIGPASEEKIDKITSHLKLL